MEHDPYYHTDLAWIHHAGYAGYVQSTQGGIVERLRAHGLSPGARVLDVGCGSGRLARVLLDAGYAVCGIDASPPMVDLARDVARGAEFRVMPLPTRSVAGAPDAVPAADAIVSTGHVLNYLDSRDDLALALAELAGALRPGGLLAIDLMTDDFANARDLQFPHAKIEDDWVIVTRFSRPAAHRYDRDITVFRRVDGVWRRSDERHRNVTFEIDAALAILRTHGVAARCEPAFGDEALPQGLVVLTGTKR